MTEKEELLERLEISPGDWVVRITLIEMAVLEGDMAFAKRLVRASPSDQPTPPEAQIRIHELLTKGLAAFSERKAEIPPASVLEERPPEPVSEPPEAAVTSLEKSDSVEREPLSVSKDLDGGLGALIESDSLSVLSPASSRRSSSRKRKGEERKVDRKSLQDKWRNYDGGLELVAIPIPELPLEPSSAGERFSSLSMALLLHVILFVLIGLVIVETPQPKPPELIVSVLHEKEADLVTTRITKPSLEIQPAAAAAQAVDVLSSIASSSFSVPDVENRDVAIVDSLLMGVQPAGNGMSFSSDAVKSSDVNFFGISGSGRKIVFVIDASPDMLVDEKGGMVAYDKVKTEVGIMLANLNRGTHFNILLYQGKQLLAFRESPVPGLPSNLRLAIEWLDPLNRNYDALGLRNQVGINCEVSDQEGFPIAATDVAFYTKAVQKAMEWEASSVFCIASGYEPMNRAPTPEMLEKMTSNPPAPPSAVDPRELKIWQDAIEKTRVWLEKENAARSEKGLSPKVVVNFNQLVREITGAIPPARRGGGNGGGGAPSGLPGLPGVTPEDIERQIDLLVKGGYKEAGLEEPGLNIVLFLGEKEEIGAEEDHFKTLTRKNRGKLKILRGLAAMQNVTGR
ncbi:MAG: hypothetical protein KA250_11085 [Verrucomicrobiales bacterium]|jgi:hypothetical protein|nr:hypothetical protein [Verrucomicrobiales bacterium]MBP9225927.1 hypothetical protein [Verrucomicrobiales bacterium]